MPDTEIEYHDLLDAVDRLTKPDRRSIRQDLLTEGKVTGTQRVTVELPPLLERLDEAIRSSLGGTAGGASLAHERAILDTDALFMFIKIASIIRDWTIAARLRPTGDAGKDLRAWYTATLAHPLSDEVEAFHSRMLHGWAGQILGKLDPWREKDLPDACPVCGATEWWNKADGLPYTRPLIVRYKPDGADMIQQARALCRACEEVWSVRALAYDLEQAAGRHAEPTG